ncbi:MAG: hypothetical protein AAGC46_17280, partial [Solirubrobacteraceae bacterium]|nr:hypothetical protein [Patulibacter sp.]
LGSGSRTGQGRLSSSPAFVIDSLLPAVLLPPDLAGLPVKTTKGGALQLRALKLTRTGKYCPEFVRVTVTAKHRSTTFRRAKPNRLNGACELSGKYALAAHTTKATSATYSVRSAGSGGGIKTRKGSVRLLT